MKEKCVDEGEEWKTCEIFLYCESITNNVWVPSKNREKWLLLLSCLSVRMEQLGSRCPDFHDIRYLSIFLRATRKQQKKKEKKKVTIFRKSAEKIQV